MAFSNPIKQDGGQNAVHAREVLPTDKTLPVTLGDYVELKERHANLINSFGLLKERHAKLVEASQDLIEGRDWPREKLSRVEKLLESEGINDPTS